MSHVADYLLYPLTLGSRLQGRGQMRTVDKQSVVHVARLVAYAVPAEVEFRSSLPKSMIGTVLRRQQCEEEVSKQQTGWSGRFFAEYLGWAYLTAANTSSTLSAVAGWSV